MHLGAAAECKQVLLRGDIMELQTLGGTIVEPILFRSRWLLTAAEGEPGRRMAVSPLKEREGQVCRRVPHYTLELMEHEAHEVNSSKS